MTNKHHFLVITILLLFGGCVENSSSNTDYMVLDEIVYVNQFPQTIKLTDAVRIEPDVIGGTKFAILDSISIFSTLNPKGMWSFFSFPNYDHLGSFLIKGNGPDELLFSPWIRSNNSFYSKDGELFASIYDSRKGRILEMNITQTLADKNLDIRLVADSLPLNMLSVVRLDSIRIFCRELNGNIGEDLTSQERVLLQNGIRSIPPVLKKLNKASLMPGGDINIMGALTGYNEETGRIVEMAIHLNYINIYTLDGTFAKTICTGTKLDNIKDIQRLSYAERIYRHAALCVYDNMFGILKIDEDYGTYDLKRKKLPSIQVFNMDGEPLIEFKLDRFITSFDIDFKNGYLYTYDQMTEELFKYNIANTL